MLAFLALQDRCMLCFSVSVFSSAQLLPTGLSCILNISFGNAECSCHSVRKDYEVPSISFSVTEVAQLIAGDPLEFTVST